MRIGDDDNMRMLYYIYYTCMRVHTHFFVLIYFHICAYIEIIILLLRIKIIVVGIWRIHLLCKTKNYCKIKYHVTHAYIYILRVLYCESVKNTHYTLEIVKLTYYFEFSENSFLEFLFHLIKL